jgi:predicted glycoside hydrolase/deacetylase ChbG (UPF0249 family)
VRRDQHVLRAIFNADDLGLSLGINRGIIAAAERGIVRSASLLVNQAATADAVNLLRSTASLRIGLHVNLVLGRPIAPASRVASLLGADGCFLPLRRLALRAVTGRLDSSEIILEIEAQARRASDLGVDLTHFDSHRYTQAFPVVARCMMAVMERIGVERVRSARNGWFWSEQGTSARGWRRRSALALGAVLGGGFRRFRSPDAVFGIPALGEYGDARERIRRIARIRRSGVIEVVCHPGYVDGELARLDSYAAAREVELAALTDPAVAADLEHEGVELIDYSAL